MNGRKNQEPNTTRTQPWQKQATAWGGKEYKKEEVVGVRANANEVSVAGEGSSPACPNQRVGGTGKKAAGRAEVEGGGSSVCGTQPCAANHGRHATMSRGVMASRGAQPHRAVTTEQYGEGTRREGRRDCVVAHACRPREGGVRGTRSSQECGGAAAK